MDKPMYVYWRTENGLSKIHIQTWDVPAKMLCGHLRMESIIPFTRKVDDPDDICQRCLKAWRRDTGGDS